MTDHFKERSTREYRQKQLFSKEELERRESLCVHEQPPFCAAACPLKLDVREFVRLTAAGDLAAARAMLERITPFPAILAAGCEHPCEGACRLGEMGEGLSIAALERSVMVHGAPKTGKGLLKFKKKKTAAVFGAELFTLAAAGELAGKSYPTTFFVAEDSAGAVINKCAPFLTEEDAQAEAARLSAMDMRIVYGADLSPALVAEKKGDYDIVCAARDFSAGESDGVTLVGPDGVIAASADHPGVLGALFDARRAGVSADRIAQGMDPAASRGEEGPVPSRLYTNLEDVPPTRRVEERGIYTPEQAREEAARCIQCSCGECLKGCAYLRHYGKHPRVLTREIYNNTGIIMGDHMMNKAMNSCSLCGQCTVTCPSGYDMADICLKARENMVDTQKMSLAVHEFALYDMLFSNGEAFLSRPQPGQENCRYVFFPGCQAGAVAPEAVYRAYRDLTQRLSGGVALLLGCCGAIAKWAGRRALREEQNALLRKALEDLGNPTVIAGCPTCKGTLAKAGLGEAVGLWDILREIGLPEGVSRLDRSAVLHDACGARGEPETREAVREIARDLGCDLMDTAWSGEKTACCGYGGLVSYVNREVAGEMARSCMAEKPDAPYITYCMACRDRFAREGAESMHLMELIYDAPAGTPPDISEKRRNRLSLRERLLKDVWGEDTAMEGLDFKLEIPEEVRALMDERMILESDIAAVMKSYRQAGEAVLDNDTGLLLTRRRLGNVTFWVKFTEEADGYCVKGAYSHRMTVETR